MALLVIYFINFNTAMYCIFVINNCLHASVFYLLFLTDVMSIKIFLAHHGYIIPVFIMFASTFKVLTGLSLAIVLARFLARKGAAVLTAPEPKQR